MLHGATADNLAICFRLKVPRIHSCFDNVMTEFMISNRTDA